MEIFWEKLELISYDPESLTRTTYSNMYGILYKYILDSSKNKHKDTLYEIPYYDYIYQNTSTIIITMLEKLVINNIDEYNDNFYHYNTLMEKINNIYEYYNKQITIYNTKFVGNKLKIDSKNL